MNNFKKASYIVYGGLALAFVFMLGIFFNAYVVNAKLTDKVSSSTNFYEDWYGKKVVWYGDSVTELNYHCSIVNDYFNFEGYNCGIRGSAISNIYGNEINLCNESRTQYPGVEIPDDVEVIFIMAGTNDWCENVALGDKTLKFDGAGNLIADVSTFYGGAHSMFNYLTRKYPNAYIFFLGTPIVASNLYNLYNEQGLTSFDYGDALCEAASMWGIQSINIGEMMGINVNNVGDSAGEMYEGLHFTEGAGRKAANVIIQELCSRRFIN